MPNTNFSGLPQRGAALMGALADPTRKTIFNMLISKPLVVKVIAADLPISQSAVSQHLKVMKEAGLVLDEVQGRSHLYSANPVALDWLSWQFGLLRDDVLNEIEQEETPEEYDIADMAMEQWAQQWSELDTLTNSVMLRLCLIGRHLDWLFERMAIRFDLSSEQLRLMSTIDRVPQGQCSLTSLAKINFSQITATQIHIQPLVDKGLIENLVVEHGAETVINLTAQGREVLHELFDAQRMAEHAPIYQMSIEDRVKLAKLLRPLLADIRTSIRDDPFV